MLVMGLAQMLALPGGRGAGKVIRSNSGNLSVGAPVVPLWTSHTMCDSALLDCLDYVCHAALRPVAVLRMPE